jgi:gluconolactonase
LSNKHTVNFSIYSYFSFVLIFLISCTSSTIKFSNWELVTDNQNFPEGITCDNNGVLYSSNCYGGWITRIIDGKIDTFLIATDSTFSKTNGMIALNDGSLIACDYGDGAILKFSADGKIETLISGYDNTPFNRPNDLTSDKNGNIFFTDPKSYGEDKLDGRVFFYNSLNKEVKMIKDSLAFPNGIGISPIDNKLYVCESAKNRILSFNIDDEMHLIDQQTFIELPDGDPDGFNFDILGNMYVAHFGSGTLFIISPEGKILHSINTPGEKPSNVEFAGNERKTLYLTEDETNSIYKMNVSIPGYNIFK